MKITKSQLKKIILQELKQFEDPDNLEQVEDPADAVKLTAKTSSDAARKKNALDRIAAGSQEFSSPEKGIVDQIETYVSGLAALPGVDLSKHRSTLQRILKQIEALIGKKHRSEEAQDV